MTGAAVLVDAVVVAYDSADTLRECTAPLAELDWVRVIVVDNACPRDCASVVSDLPVEVIRSSVNGGFAYGCNLGIRSGCAEFVLLINPDAQIDAASLSALVAALRVDPTVAGVGPRVLDDAGGLLFTQRRFPRLRSTYAQGLFLHRAAPLADWADDAVRDLDAYRRPGRPDWISGCCVLLRRDAVAAVGGLDEGFFLYAEETDLFKRLAAAGWRAAYEPSATARHDGQGSADPNATEPIRAASRVRYARKHHGVAVAVAEALGLALGALAHAATWLRDPARARGHLDAARAALRAACSVEATAAASVARGRASR